MNRMAKFWAKRITQDQIDVYFERCQVIPDKPWWDIVDHAIDTFRSFPSRSDLIDLWTDWQRANPDKIVRPEERKECDACDSKGYVDILFIPKWIRKKVGEQGKNPKTLWDDPRAVYEGVVNCGVCGEARFARKDVRTMTPAQIDLEPWIRNAGTC